MPALELKQVAGAAAFDLTPVEITEATAAIKNAAMRESRFMRL